MIPCTNTTIGKALSYCSTDGYGDPGTLYIGELADATVTDFFILFENLATGRTTHHQNTGTAPMVEVLFPQGLSPGQMYRVSIEADGSAPVMFKPYVFNPTTNAYDVGTAEVDAVHFNASKVITESGSVSSPSEQWVNI